VTRIRILKKQELRPAVNVNDPMFGGFLKAIEGTCVLERRPSEGEAHKSIKFSGHLQP
jgi:hypothetical protein